MFTLRVGSQAYNIVRLLAVVGEFPMNSVYLLGNARVYKRTITMLSVEQKFRNPKTGEILKTKLLNISGENTDRNIRLYIGALPILNWLGFLDYYKEIVAKGHTFDEGIATIAETCTTGGLQVYTCVDCGESKMEGIPAKGHSYVEVQDLAPTCTTNGISHYSYCEVCGEGLEKVIEIAALGHTIVEDVGFAATCTTAGLSGGQHCSVCDTVLISQEEIPALGHQETVDEEVAATCTTAGKTEGKHCASCDEVLVEQTVIPALGHTEVADAEIAPTCTVDGKSEGSHCSVCEEVLVAQESIPASGHQDIPLEMIAPTCTKSGKTEGVYCPVCDEILAAQETIPALGHAVAVDAAVEATCTNTGLSAGSHCVLCEEVFVAQTTLPVKEHSAVVDKAVAATCYTEGKTEGTHCGDCDQVLTAQQSITKLAHVFTGDVCKNCGTDACKTTLTFLADGVEVGKVEYDINSEEIVAPTVPEKTGYTGAWEEYEMDYESKTINAVYTARVYTIRYVRASSGNYDIFGENSEHRKAGITDGNYPTEYTIESGDLVISNLKTGYSCACGQGATYRFNGWYLDAEKTVKFSGTIPTGSTGDIILYADIQLTATHFY